MYSANVIPLYQEEGKTEKKIHVNLFVIRLARVTLCACVCGECDAGHIGYNGRCVQQAGAD